MSANLEAKKQVVEEIKGKIEGSKSVVFADCLLYTSDAADE